MSKILRSPLRRDPGVLANLIGLVANLVLMLAKFVYGTLASSYAVVADGFNSAGDILATGIAFAGYLWAKKPADDDHHYGHGNAENLAGMLIGGMLFATGVFIAIEGVLVLIRGGAEAPGMPAVYVACGTIVAKEILYRYVQGVGARLRSASLRASARDHRADVFVGFVVLAGVLGARTGLPWLDPVAALCVGLWIVVFAIKPILENFDVLMDRAPIEMRDQIEAEVHKVDGVLGCEAVKVHPLGADLNISLEILLPGELSLQDAHDKAHEVEDAILAGIDGAVSVHVHVNPALE